MNWFEHEYLVPIFIGTPKRASEFAKVLKKFRQIRIHFFSERFELLQGVFLKCHSVVPYREELLLIALLDFSAELEEYKYPVIIYGDDMDGFISRHIDELESRFLTVSFVDAYRMINGDGYGI